GALRVGRAHEATLVLVAEPSVNGADGEPVTATDAAGAREEDDSPLPPAAVVRGNASRLGVVRTRLGSDDSEEPSLAGELARRVSSGAAQRLDDEHDDWNELLAPGDVTFVSSELGETLAKLPNAS